jgi:hydroxymethylbilane synthase
MKATRKPVIKISARKSDLARLQAYHVGAAIQKKFKNFQVQYSFRESLGDRNLENPLWKMPEKGVFTQDFKEDLILGRTDLVVHSWKDIPIEDTAETVIAATLGRADERDVLLFKKKYLTDKPSELKIFSSSPRRAFNLTPFFQWSLPFKPASVAFEPVRGNIQTRVLKTIESDTAHGIIVAKAALDRLLSDKNKEFLPTQKFLKKALKDFAVQIIPLSQSPTSAAQGSLAIEISKKNTRIKSILKEINQINDFNLVNKERAHFKTWGGGCHQKMGVTFKNQNGHLVKFERGLDQKDNFVWNQEIIQTQNGSLKNPIQQRQLAEFHNDLTKLTEKLKPYKAKKSDALIVTKGNLLATDSAQPQVLWTSGIETWKQLAEQGYWVTGSYDSLGESKSPEVDVLLGGKQKWKKLTHKNGHTKKWAKTLKLYEVSYSGFEKVAEHKNKDYFFWSHGDLFLASLKRFPWLKKKKHICGLGSTLDVISKHLDSKNIITVYNFKEWKKKWTQ